MMQDSDWKKIRSEYPVTENFIWLNNCGTTPASMRAVNAVHQYLTGYAGAGVFSETEKYPAVKRFIKDTLAEIIHCRKEEIALMHNTAEGLNTVSIGLDLQKGDEILVLENEYPSNVYPWEHWRSKGVILKFVPMAESPSDFLQKFNSLVTDRTRVAALSAVHWCTGMVFPLREIGKICSEKNILFAVDAAQGVGNTEINVREMKIDVMAFSAWKWLLGPLGMGVLFVNSEKLDKIRLIFKGTDSVVNPDVYLPYREELQPGAERFELSTANYSDWVYFRHTLLMLSEIGFDRVRMRIHELSDFLSDLLKKKGYSLASEKFSEKTGIVAFSKKNLDSAKTAAGLKENKIICADRLGRVRFSPHIYNSFEELEKTVSILESAAVFR